jgi:hypothetical protein
MSESTDPPPQTRIVRIAGVDVTQLPTGAYQFMCTHGAPVNASLKADGWHSYASCGKCPPDALQPVLDAIQAAGSNGNPEEPKPDQKQHFANGAGHRDSNGSKSDGLYARLKAEIQANPERAFALILGSELTRKSNSRELFATCPFHEDRNPSFRVNLEKSRWFCDPCGRGGDAFGLAGEVWSADFKAALPRLAELLLSGGNHKKADKAEAPKEIVRTLRYEIRDLDGELKATHIRHEYDDGSKSMPWEPAGTKPALLPLYGINRTADSADGETIVLCEGEKPTDSLWERRILAVGTVTGAGIKANPVR